MFDRDSFDCRVKPDVLFKMIREYVPRTTEGAKVEYPPPTHQTEITSTSS